MLDEKFARKFLHICPNAAFFSRFGLANAVVRTNFPGGPDRSLYDRLCRELTEAVDVGATDGLNCLWAASSRTEKAIILGEAVFTLVAGRKEIPLLADWTFKTFNDFSTIQIQSMVEEIADEETKKISIALREWAIVASAYFSEFSTPKHVAQCFFVRSQLTCMALASRLDLVGEAMMSAVTHLRSIDEIELATDFCSSVCKDLEPLFESLSEPNSLENRRGVFWLNEACKIAIELGKEEFVGLGRRVSNAMRKHRISAFQDKPRFGPVISIYLPSVEWMAEVLTDFGQTDENDEESLEKLCIDYGITEYDADLIDRALDSFIHGTPSSNPNDLSETLGVSFDIVMQAAQLAERRGVSM